MTWLDKNIPEHCPACAKAWHRTRNPWWWMAHIQDKTKIYCRNCYTVTGEIDFKTRHYEPLQKQEDARVELARYEIERKPR